MRAIIQRVTSASVVVNDVLISNIQAGYLILLGIETEDNAEDREWLVKKIAALRVFNDTEGKMNLSIDDVNGDILVISQFTLHASTKKGNRPSFLKAAKPDFAELEYQSFCKDLQQNIKGKVLQGVFGADMKVALLNDGPVTISIDTKNKE